jgi:Flp pilus assembly protein TadD
LPLPSDDFQWHVLRGRAFAGLRERDRADEEYRRALELKADKHIRYERIRNRGFQLVALDRFSEAADSFAQALAHSPNDCHLWTFLATAQFMAGDATTYRRTCHSMFERFKNDTDGSHLFNLAWTCTLLPDALPDMQALAPVAQTAAGWWIDSERVLVATHYRVGRYEDALSSLDRLTQVIRPEPAALFFGAMAHQRLGQKEEAQQKLREGIAAMATTATRYATRVHLLDFDRRAWTDKVTDRLLRMEAEALILAADDRDATIRELRQ